jgi:hypothetical protein
MAFNRLYGVIYQKTEPLIPTAAITSKSLGMKRKAPFQRRKAQMSLLPAQRSAVGTRKHLSRYEEEKQGRREKRRKSWQCEINRDESVCVSFGLTLPQGQVRIREAERSTGGRRSNRTPATQCLKTRRTLTVTIAHAVNSSSTSPQTWATFPSHLRQTLS